MHSDTSTQYNKQTHDSIKLDWLYQTCGSGMCVKTTKVSNNRQSTWFKRD